jgi:hypothetical protein
VNGNWTAYQALAWIAWRNSKAVRMFSRADAEQLWKAARAGDYPKGLGRPKTLPVAAEMELHSAMMIGRLRPITP